MSSGATKFEFSDRLEISELCNNLVLKQLVAEGNSDGALSMTWVKLNGHHRSLRTRSQLRIYFIISGSFLFQVDDNQSYQLNKHDVLTLKAGSDYYLEGNGEYLVINTPAFKEGDDEYL